MRWSIALLLWLTAGCHSILANEYFTIEVVDDQTGRGVPLVEVSTVNNLSYVTDSAGIVAFHEPGLMNQTVFFSFKSHGYEFEKDMFGFAGKKLEVTPGGQAQVKIKRRNIAERLYRITGAGIYADSVLVGRKPPIEQPLLNAQVFGQDSTQAVIYKDKIWWFWGDTHRASYPLGNFATTGAISALPGQVGLDPSVGVNLEYFKDDEGFTKKMIPLEGKVNPVWLLSLIVLPDESGNERMAGYFIRVKSLGENLEAGIVAYNDSTGIFDKIVDIPVDAPLAPFSQAMQARVDGVDYIYCTNPYPNIRVKADWKSFCDILQYEGYTPLVAGGRFEKAETKLDRAGGTLNWAWRKNTPPLTSRQQKELVDAGLMKVEESPNYLRDIDSGNLFLLHNCTAYWNEYRRKYVMIGLELDGTSALGEVWYAEADKPEGPWGFAKKIVTHNRYSFYNPRRHPFFDQEGGRFVYFEATYTNALNDTTPPTPRYEYNQVMYRLDLSDERLKAVQSGGGRGEAPAGNPAPPRPPAP